MTSTTAWCPCEHLPVGHLNPTLAQLSHTQLNGESHNANHLNQGRRDHPNHAHRRNLCKCTEAGELQKEMAEQTTTKQRMAAHAIALSPLHVHGQIPRYTKKSATKRRFSVFKPLVDLFVWVLGVGQCEDSHEVLHFHDIPSAS